MERRWLALARSYDFAERIETFLAGSNGFNNRSKRRVGDFARSALDQAVLYKFTDRLFHAETLIEVYEAALDAIIKGLRCNRSSILVFDDVDVMRFVASRNLSEAYCKAVDGHSPWTRASKDAEPICVNDIDAAHFPNELKNTIKQEGIRALAFIPLFAERKLVGKFMTYYDAPHVFTERELDLAVIIARQLGFAIDHKRTQETKDILTREIEHRSANLLATVQAIAKHSFGTKYNLKEARDVFNGRIQQLARTHAQLTKRSWNKVAIGEIARTVLAPFADRLKIKGDEVLLSPQHVQNFALVLHELSTNAAKYGALSRLNGTVNVSWIPIHDSGVLRFSWDEHDGPAVVPPTREGFGTVLARRAFPSAQFEYLQQGLNCTFEIPIRHEGAD
jgi:two-component sensor histidine kinase